MHNLDDKHSTRQGFEPGVYVVQCSFFYAFLCRKVMVSIFFTLLISRLTVFALTQTSFCGLYIVHCLSLIFMLIYTLGIQINSSCPS